MLKGRVAFTGRLASMTRAQAFVLIENLGGTPGKGVTKSSTALIAGELGWPLLADGHPSRSLAKAQAWGIPVISERRFLAWTGRASADAQTKAYTKAQLTALAKISPDRIDEFEIFGLLEPQDGRYGFRDLAAARQLAKLLGLGVKLSTITQSLAEIRKWLPEAGLANLRLYPEGPDRLLVEDARGLSDKKGQYMLPMKASVLDADAVFSEAQAAEDAQDWQNAERLYTLAMKLDPADTASAFNLANMLRAQRKYIEAEAAYRSAADKDPHFAEAWYNLAHLLEEQRRSTEAISCLKRAITAEPDYTDAIFNLALLLHRLERPGEAAPYWQRYLKLDHASAWAERAKRALKLCEMEMACA